MCTFVIFFLSFPFFMFLSYGWSFWLCWVYTVQPGFYCSVGAKYSRINSDFNESILILKAAARQCKKLIIANNFCLEAIKRSKKNFKATKTVCIVVGLFLVCWMPCLVTSFVNYFTHCGLFCYYYTVWIYVEVTAFSSSGINPWVYCLRHDEFYKTLTATFRPRRRQISLDQNRFHQTKSCVQRQRQLLIRLI